MGLDFFEVVPEVEEAFDISLREADLPEMISIGNLYNAALAALQAQHPHRFASNPTYAEQVWAELSQLLQSQLGLSPEQIVPSARFYYELGFR